MPRYLTDLADVLRGAGLKVVEIPGWKTRAATMSGKPGPFDPGGISIHYTAGKGGGYAYAEWMATVGYIPTLYPPLAQLGLDRDGTWYVQAAGRANHAGRCRLIAGLKPIPGKSYGDGNTQQLGVEAMNTGTEGWTVVQYDAYVAGVRVLCDHYGWPVSRVLGHKETSLEGKVDPDFDMDQFRRDVAAYQEGDIMAVISAEEVVQKIRNAVLFDQVIGIIGRDDKMSLATAARVIYDRVKGHDAELDAVKAQLAALGEVLAEQSQGQVTVEDVLSRIDAAGERVAKARLANPKVSFEDETAPAPEVQQ